MEGSHKEATLDLTAAARIGKSWLCFLLFYYFTRHKISITLVSIKCLDHMHGTSKIFILPFTKGLPTQSHYSPLGV